MAKVNLPKVEAGTRDRLDNFRTTHNVKNPHNRLRTAGDTIDYLIEAVQFYETIVSEDDIKEFLKKQGIENLSMSEK
jgi:hypothetical protein